MGCFSTCFDACKPSRRRRRRSRKNHNSLLHHLQKYESIEEFNVPKLIQEGEDDIDENEEEENHKGENPNLISLDTKGDKRKEDANLSGRKKVTFDLNVKFYEDLTRDEDEDEDEEEDGDDKDDDDDEMSEAEIDEVIREIKAKAGFVCECGSDSSSSSLFSYPRNHRYQNCRDSDDEIDEVMSSDESDVEEYSDDDEVELEEQSSESLFSLSIDSRKHKLGSVGADKEVNSPMPVKKSVPNDSDSRCDRTKGVDSVLNPVENLTQWKDMKARSRIASIDQAKENKHSVHDFSFSEKKETLEMGVDTSLSTWLVGSEQGKTERSNSRDGSVSVGNSPSDRKTVSPNKFEDRPILGALTMEEIRLISASSTPRKSPTRSPDDMPIIGSVGSYWTRTGQTTASGGSSAKSTKSRYRESAEVIWDSTPFEARLEKALEKEEVSAVLHNEAQKV
ncbi:hypothetical protein RND81_04G032600 [Saponaria officinalis]|uniref:Uncharacterized protein n=1 Tax=Saponaria officinalis TaxID=3572 RepID=A0AAW1LFZ0_SAPOF